LSHESRIRTKGFFYKEISPIVKKVEKFFLLEISQTKKILLKKIFFEKNFNFSFWLLFHGKGPSPTNLPDNLIKKIRQILVK